MKIGSSLRLQNRELWKTVVELFKTQIGDDFFLEYKHRIIFAIAIDSTECWLLPLYETEKKKIDKQQNCFDVLQKALSKKGIKLKKDRRTYERISDPYTKKKTLEKNYRKNKSLELFVQEINSKKIAVE